MIIRCFLWVMLIIFVVPSFCGAVTSDVSVEGLLNVIGTAEISNNLKVGTTESAARLVISNGGGTDPLVIIKNTATALTMTSSGTLEISNSVSIGTTESTAKLLVSNGGGTSPLMQVKNAALVFNITDSGTVEIGNSASIGTTESTAKLVISNGGGSGNILSVKNPGAVLTINGNGTIEVPANAKLVLNTGTARPYVVSENAGQQIIQRGFANGNGTANNAVTFSVAFSSAPTVVVTGYESTTTFNNALRLNVTGVSTTGFTLLTAAAIAVTDGFYWIAIGEI